MKKRVITLMILIITFGLNLKAQDEWTPRLHVTGYVNTIGEYTDFQPYVDENVNIGVGLSEVGFLASYKPLEKLEVKTTLVYSHQLADIQSMVVEAYGMYTYSEKLRIGAGKFLTPLSPINQYFYAPLNPSGVLPMIVSHHFLTPQSIAGLQVAGEFGADMKLGYNVTYGNYTTIGHIRSGIIGLMGAEDIGALAPVLENEKQNYDLGGSARIYGNYNNLITLGLNYFQGTRATLIYTEIDIQDGELVGTGYMQTRKNSVGVDFHLDVNSALKVNAEYWMATNNSKDKLSTIDPNTGMPGAPEEVKFKYKGYYGEVLYTVGTLTPFVRFEYVDDYNMLGKVAGADIEAFRGNIKISSFGAGIAYRPIYEIMLKLDYRLINVNINDALKNVGLGLDDDKYNHVMASVVVSF